MKPETLGQRQAHGICIPVNAAGVIGSCPHVLQVRGSKVVIAITVVLQAVTSDTMNEIRVAVGIQYLVALHCVGAISSRSGVYLRGLCCRGMSNILGIQ